MSVISIDDHLYVGLLDYIIQFNCIIYIALFIRTLHIYACY